METVQQTEQNKPGRAMSTSAPPQQSVNLPPLVLEPPRESFVVPNAVSPGLGNANNNLDYPPSYSFREAQENIRTENPATVNTARTSRKPGHYWTSLLMSIFSFVFGFWPVGGVALILSLRSDVLYKRNERSESKKLSDLSLRLSVAGIMVGAIISAILYYPQRYMYSLISGKYAIRC